MRTYETVFVLKPDMTQEDLEKNLEFYKESITKHGGEIVKVEPWGKVQMAYPVDGFSEGVYYLIQFKAETSYITELELRYRYNESVLRNVVVMIDEKKFKLNPRRDPIKRERKPAREGAPVRRGRRPADEEGAEAPEAEVAAPAEEQAAE